MAEDITFSREEELAAYRSMLLIRRFEEKAGQLYALGAINGVCPLSIGQEAAVTGTLMAARPTDPIVSSLRSHGHMLARGIPPDVIFAELLGRTSGISKGRGGSAHMISQAHAFFGGPGVPGASAGIATGLAFASRYRKSDDVVLCFFGDGTAAKGRIFESYRIAADWKLPIVFVIENNTASTAVGGTLDDTPSNLAAAGVPYGIPGEQVDGIDVRRARSGAACAIGRARSGAGPQIIEILTYRYRGHGGLPARAGASEKRRDDADPITKSRARLIECGDATDAALKAIEKEVREQVIAAASAAKAAPMQTNVSAVLDGVSP
jgi:pyruvate dehydrogenase E1 component alpha subunit